MKKVNFTNWDEMREESEKNRNNPDIWVIKFGHEINTVYDAYNFLMDHPNAVDSDSSKEWKKLTLADRWLESSGQFMRHMEVYVDEEGVAIETGPIYWNKWTKSWEPNMHDIRLDVRAKTFEKALIKLAKKVRKYYGNY